MWQECIFVLSCLLFIASILTYGQGPICCFYCFNLHTLFSICLPPQIPPHILEY